MLKKSKKEDEEKAEDTQEGISPDISEKPSDIPAGTDKNLNDLVSDMPQVVPDAVQAAQEAEKSEAEQIKDSKGDIFDPAIHAVGEDGKPKLTPKKGQFAKIRLPKDKPVPSGMVSGPTPQAITANQRATAIVISGVFIQTGCVIFGDEWQPEKTQKYDEKAYLIESTEEYLRVSGMETLPPWLLLVVAYGSYGLKRFTRPQTKTVLQKMGDWFNGIVGRIYNRLKGRKNALSNIRNNRNGQDNPSDQKNSPAI